MTNKHALPTEMAVSKNGEKEQSWGNESGMRSLDSGSRPE